MDATIVKIGGSLALYPEKLRALGAKLSEISKKHRLIVVPGGGEFADVARDLDKRFNLSCETSHRMAILGMDQYGFLLSELIHNSSIVNQLENLQKVLDSPKLPVFLPANFLLSEDPLENSWDVTSDSIAVYIAGRLQVRKVLLVTDVDGVYTCDPKKHSDAKLIKKLSAEGLLAMNKRTSVDKFLPELLLKLPIDCFVVNGLFPERVEAVLDGQEAVCTLIN
jgi:aspartokinase-like uncharacterized kinase